MKPRALLIARNLPPLQGGIERLMQHAVGQLSTAWACDILGPAGSAAALGHTGTVVEFPADAVRFLLGAAVHLAWRKPQCQLVLASSGLMAPLARLAAHRSGSPYIVWVHGLDLTYPNPVYRGVAFAAIRAAGKVIANSRHTAALAAAAGVAAGRIAVIPPGVAAGPVAADAAAAAFAARRGLRDRPLMLFVGRLVERKGVVEFVERALPDILRACPDARFLVVGAEPGRAEQATDAYRERIRAAARRARVEDAVILAGAIGDEELQQAYAAADVLVFPVIERPGDVEGFGMVAVEAAAQGTPSVAFAVGGVVDAVSADNGVLVQPGDYPALAAAIVGFLRGTASSGTAQSCRAHARAHSWDRYGEALRKLCRDVAEIAP